MIPIVPGEGGVDQRQTADAPPEHQQDQYPMRKLSELRRYAERQAYRPDGGCCFIQADGKRKIFCRADDAPAGEKQHQIQQQNGRSAFYNAAVDAAVKKLSEEYFGGRMDYAVGAKEGVRCKPYPDLVDDALKALGETREGAVFIGDSEVDVQTGLNAGLDVIAVSWGFRSREVVIEGGAKMIADDASELEKLILE